VIYEAAVDAIGGAGSATADVGGVDVEYVQFFNLRAPDNPVEKF
jgi:hypothetical protein